MGSCARALEYAKLCKLSYSDTLPELQEYQCQLLNGSNGSDVQVLVCTNDSTQIFVFRGTESITDACIDLSFIKQHFRDSAPGVKVHSGFLYQYNDIFDKLVRIFDNNKKIIFTGHSLGGALATLAAADCKHFAQNYITCVTFGAPRVGNYHFVKYFNRVVHQSERYVLGDDIVTQNPKILYYHVKGLIHLETKKAPFCCQSIENHDIDMYVSFLQHF